MPAITDGILESPDQNTDENDFSEDGGLLFELDGDDTGFDGIFEEQ